MDYGAFRSFGRVYPQDVEPDPDLLAEEERLIAREEELAAQNDGEVQNLARNYPLGRDAICSVPTAASECRRFTGRTQYRGQPLDRTVSVAVFWTNLCIRVLIVSSL